MENFLPFLILGTRNSVRRDVTNIYGVLNENLLLGSINLFRNHLARSAVEDRFGLHVTKKNGDRQQVYSYSHLPGRGEKTTAENSLHVLLHVLPGKSWLQCQCVLCLIMTSAPCSFLQAGPNAAVQ